VLGLLRMWDAQKLLVHQKNRTSYGVIAQAAHSDERLCGQSPCSAASRRATARYPKRLQDVGSRVL